MRKLGSLNCRELPSIDTCQLGSRCGEANNGLLIRLAERFADQDHVVRLQVLEFLWRKRCATDFQAGDHRQVINGDRPFRWLSVNDLSEKCKNRFAAGN